MSFLCFALLILKGVPPFATLMYFRWQLRTWGRKALCCSSFVPSSSRRTCQRSWSRMPRSDSSSCRWRRESSTTTSTAPQKQPSFSPPTPCRPSMPTTTRRCTRLVTCPANNCSPRGKARFSLRWGSIAHDFWCFCAALSGFWTSTSLTRTSGRSAFRCGMRSTRAWWGNQEILWCFIWSLRALQLDLITFWTTLFHNYSVISSVSV